MPMTYNEMQDRVFALEKRVDELTTRLNYTVTPVAKQYDMQELIDMCHQASVDAGWWLNLDTGEPKERNKGEMIALIHSELSECLEGFRKNKMDDHLPHRKMEEVEMADTVIRIFDYCKGHGLDLIGAMVEKLEYNKNRADHKMENRLKADGKKI